MTTVNKLIDELQQHKVELVAQLQQTQYEIERLCNIRDFAVIPAIGTVTIALQDSNSILLEYSQFVIEVRPAPHLILLVDGLPISMRNVVRWSDSNFR